MARPLGRTVEGRNSDSLASSRGIARELNVVRAYTDGLSRLFKFPQMDFEMAVWEMTHLLIAPKKVFKSIYYHKRRSSPSAKTTLS